MNQPRRRVCIQAASLILLYISNLTQPPRWPPLILDGWKSFGNLLENHRGMHGIKYIPNSP